MTTPHEDHKINMERVQEAITVLKLAFDTISSSNDTRIQAIRQNNATRIQDLRKELDTFEQMKDPETVIAIVGATGEGKSSLINALLEHRSVLPTSAIRACTAVVVEVAQNKTSDHFEADIEFLTQKDWSDELECLIKDLTNNQELLKKHPPDSSSNMYASYLKVRAVYGKIDKMEVLDESTTITKWLGKSKTLTSADPEEFREQVEQYIKQTDEDEMQYWPIVKRVRLRIPDCDVCSSGAVLVELPGVRDFNAARENVSKEYMKNCKAVWVVASIHRATDDKTARNLLGYNLRRQLLMDGQYDNIAFICSKTDVIEPSELAWVTKRFGMKPQIDKKKSEIAEMEGEIKQTYRDLRAYQHEIGFIEEQIKELKRTIERVEDQEDTNDTLSKIAEEARRIGEIDGEIDRCKSRINELKQKLTVDRKEIANICAKARNKYSTGKIKKDFKTGIKVQYSIRMVKPVTTILVTLS